MVITLREVRNRIKSREDAHKLEVEKFMRRRILPVHEGNIQIQWIEKLIGFDADAALAAEPAKVLKLNQIIAGFQQDYPKKSTYIDIRKVAKFKE